MMRNKGNKLYIGVSKNPTARLYDHTRKYGAQFTQHNPSFRIVFLEKHSNLSEARKREIQIKKWRREKKEFLIEKYKAGLETKMF